MAEGNAVKRITDRYAAQEAVNLMIEDMQTTWDGFKCDGVITPHRNWGAYVTVHIPLEDEPDAHTVARLFRKGDAYLCVVDFYIGEDTSFKATDGKSYKIDDYDNMIED